MADKKVYDIKINGIDQANEELKDLNKTLGEVSAQKQADAFKKLGESLAGAFATATVAADAFGISGKTLQEAQTRATQLVVALDGVKKITEGLSAENFKFAKSAFDSFKQAGIGAKLFGTATRTAITATGIGALLLLLPLIIENFDKIKEAVGKAFSFTPLGVFVNYITKIVDDLGGLGNVLTATGAALKAFFTIGKDASDEFNKSIEKGKKIQSLEKEAELLKSVNEERARQIRLLESQSGKEAEIFKLKQQSFKDELNNIQSLKRAGQELTADQIKRAKDLDTELKILQNKETDRLTQKAAKEKDIRDKANAQAIKDAQQRAKDEADIFEGILKDADDANTKELAQLEKNQKDLQDVYKSTKDVINKNVNEVLDNSNKPTIQTKSLFDYVFGTGNDKESDPKKQAAVNDLVNAAAQAYTSAFSAILGALDQSIENTRDRIDSVETETTQTLSNINSLEEQLDNAQGARREQVLARLDKERQKEKQLAAEKKQLADKLAADERKRAALTKAQAIATATINIATGVTKAIAEGGTFGIITGALVAAAGAAQLAIIASQEFENGGVLKGPSHANGGIPIVAEGGEAVINKRSTAMFKPLLSSINQAGGGVPFAENGIATTPDFSAIQSIATGAPNADLVNAMKQFKFKIDVTEFTSILEGSRLSEERASF